MTSTNGKINVFIFDIDGTLACHKPHRGPFEEHKVYEDTVIEPVVAVAKALANSGYKIIFLSGRTDGCKEDTERWIMDKVGVFGFALHMRIKGDQRKDAIVKKEIYERDILPYYNVIGVFDDRLQVCRMLYENEIFCFNVNQGLKEF
jgi:hypothetical protein